MKKKLFINEFEKVTNDILNEKCNKHNISIQSKIRLADVFEIENSGLTSDMFSYALKSHFDFIVYNQLYEPLFAVEVDGIYHKTNGKQILNDEYKNNLCSKFELPLLRVNSNYLNKSFRTFSLLGWMIDIWFLREAFFDAQEHGIVPEDEIFTPEAILCESNNPMKHPYDITYDLKRKVYEKYKSGELYHYCTNVWSGTDKDGKYRGVGYFMISENEGIITESGIKSTSFPVVESEVLEMILTYELLEKALSGKYEKVDIARIYEKVNFYSNRFKLDMVSTFTKGK